MINVAVMGCTGRMGQLVSCQVLHNPEKYKLVGGTAKSDSEHIGKDIGRFLHKENLGISITTDTHDAIRDAHVVIDFTQPEAASRHALAAAQAGIPYITGTTGLGKDLQQDIVNASTQIPVVFSPNMSIGITLLTNIVEQVAKTLDASYDIEICEMHHRHKLDAPSGTAIALGHAAAHGRGLHLDDHATKCRTGRRNPGEIGFAVMRGGEIAGDHSVLFAGDHELITISHRALNRNVFASGALKAAEWLIQQKPGLYDMHQVLGLS